MYGYMSYVYACLMFCLTVHRALYVSVLHDGVRGTAVCMYMQDTNARAAGPYNIGCICISRGAVQTDQSCSAGWSVWSDSHAAADVNTACTWRGHRSGPLQQQQPHPGVRNTNSILLELVVNGEQGRSHGMHCYFHDHHTTVTTSPSERSDTDQRASRERVKGRCALREPDPGQPAGQGQAQSTYTAFYGLEQGLSLMPKWMPNCRRRRRRAVAGARQPASTLSRQPGAAHRSSRPHPPAAPPRGSGAGSCRQARPFRASPAARRSAVLVVGSPRP